MNQAPNDGGDVTRESRAVDTCDQCGQPAENRVAVRWRRERRLLCLACVTAALEQPPPIRMNANGRAMRQVILGEAG
jgi:hypothetical protein